MPRRAASASGSVSMSLNGEPWRRSGRSWPSIPVENRHATWLRHLSPPVKIREFAGREVGGVSALKRRNKVVKLNRPAEPNEVNVDLFEMIRRRAFEFFLDRGASHGN